MNGHCGIEFKLSRYRCKYARIISAVCCSLQAFSLLHDINVRRLNTTTSRRTHSKPAIHIIIKPVSGCLSFRPAQLFSNCVCFHYYVTEPNLYYVRVFVFISRPVNWIDFEPGWLCVCGCIRRAILDGWIQR